ncbi:hypothetical protein FALBO_5975 [Fusarium albosuccineum]|uniref:Enoyl reductase (ER) domain-containing protein n=1 Tax=Fusarium albosuccineum TaxID=1237068 RepID=A0A8H4LFR2_9HYPO|nr:hypothetical protein FALBO_5975 [Fusarium albosuccineum]
MRAQQYDPGTGRLWLNEIEMPKPNSSEILVKIIGASLCRSDRLLGPGFFLTRSLGHVITMGHEVTGTVAELGNHVNGFEIGDAVGLVASSGCFECARRQTWPAHGCPHGLRAQGFTCDGHFQEYVTVDFRNAVRLPSSFDVAGSAPFCCAGVTAYNAIKQCEPAAGRWITVFGAGGVGSMGIQYAKAMGFNVIAVDIGEKQLNDAKKAGADYAFNSTIFPDYAAAIVEKTKGGVDAAVNFTASSLVYGSMQTLVKWGGILMTVGISDPFLVDPMDISFNRFVIKGACNGTAQDLKDCLQFSAQHNIVPFVEFISLEALPAMITSMETGMLNKRVYVKF